MKLQILDWENKKNGEIELEDSVFKAVIREDLISDVVRWQRARRRQGSHNAKDRGDVRGGGIKPFRQKGTGNARQGSIRSPLLRKGGVIHGPHPRSYDYKLPSSIKKIALKGTLSQLAKQGSICVVVDMLSKTGKTKDLKNSLEKIGVKKALLVDQSRDEKFYRACKNLPSCQYIPVAGLNVLDLLKYQYVVFTKAGVEQVNLRYGGKK